MSEPVIKVEDILNASRGMLQKQLYVVFTTPTNGMGVGVRPELPAARDLL